jgi:hypothetical protein
LFTTTGAGDVVELLSEGMLISEGMLKTVDGVLWAVLVVSEFFMPSMSANAPMPMASSASAPAAIFMPEPELCGATGAGAYIGCGAGA